MSETHRYMVMFGIILSQYDLYGVIYYCLKQRTLLTINSFSGTNSFFDDFAFIIRLRAGIPGLLNLLSAFNLRCYLP